MTRTYVWRVEYFDGQPFLQELKLPAALAFNQLTAEYLPDGAYTTLRTFEHNKVFRLTDHKHRLEETARLTGRSLSIDLAVMRSALRQAAMQFSSDEDLRMRVTIDLEEELGAMYILAETLTTPSEASYQHGVWVITCDLQRQIPKAKLTGFVAQSSQVRRSLPGGVNEAILVSPHGALLEGLSSNFFAVRDGILWTGDEGVLSGITRSLVLEEAYKAGIPVRLESVLHAEINNLDEAFITSASRAILPVRQIDERIIGIRTPGEITRALMRLYSARIHQELETL